MKFYIKKYKVYKNIKQYSLLVFLLMALSFYSHGQVVKAFTPRASATGQSVYTIKGDFTIIGNTNLMPNNSANASTSYTDMVYVDVDSDSNTINSSAATLQLTLDDKVTLVNCSKILYAGLYWTGRPGPNEEFEITNGTITKTVNKRKVSISGPSSNLYTEVTANTDDIYYPSGSYGNMFIAYADVTDYVKLNGTGEYNVADIALNEGTGGDMGYFGGWSMVIIYENSEMKTRNISVYDGYGYRESDIVKSNHIDLDINALNTSNLDLNTQIGIMAAEGDSNLSFDSFKIEEGTTGHYNYLNHSTNEFNNFFNSSINVGAAPRNPSLADNVGIDLSKFDLPNTYTSYLGSTHRLIDIGQPNLRFEYNAITDEYVIYNITLSFEVILPEIEAEVAITEINNIPNSLETTTIEPGQEITYKVNIKNLGLDSSTNTKLSIPIPYNTTYKNLSISSNSYAPYTPTNAPTYNAGTNTINWDLGELPVTTTTDQLLANLTFTVTATTDCKYLAVNCGNVISLNGTITGTASDTGSDFDKTLIISYDDTSCANSIVYAPIETSIINANCMVIPDSKEFLFCNTIDFSTISDFYPTGTRFYNEYPVNSTSIEYTNSNAFPINNGLTTYYATLDWSETCYLEFIINENTLTDVPSVSSTPIEYCLNETAVPLTAVPSDTSYILYYYTDNNPNTVGQTSLTPPTDTPGTFTYYVTEGIGLDCISENRVPITVKVNNLLDITSTIVNQSCMLGSIDIEVTGGSGNYSYLWSNSETTQDISNLTAGTYIVIVTDTTTGCDTVTSLTVKKETIPVATITAPSNYSIEGCNTSILTSLPISTSPSIISLTQLKTAQGGGGIATNFNAITYTDNVVGTCPTIVTRTFTATNICGDKTTAIQTITIKDETAPVVDITIPETLNFQCIEDVPAMTTLTATDNCLGVITNNETEIIDNSDPLKTIITRKWSFSDDCYNTTNITQTITVKDTIAPIVDNTTPVDLNIQCIGDLPAMASLTATDNCNGVISDNGTETIDNSDPLKTIITRKWSFSDMYSNTTNVTQTITIKDTIAPVVNTVIPTTLNFECIGDVPTMTALTATDSCDGVITDNGNEIIDNSDPCNVKIERNWSFKDNSGNITNVTQTITVKDTTAPVVNNIPANINLECTSIAVPAMASLTATDNCDGIITDNGTETIDYSDPLNTIITRKWSFSDKCNNTTNITQTITVKDNIAPIVDNTTPADLNIQCIGDLPAMTALTATDNCDGVITDNGTETIDNSDPLKTIITRKWSFSDTYSNTTNVTQIITIKDTIAPVINSTVPADLDIQCIGDLPAIVSLTATDNCDGIITDNGTETIDNSDPCNVKIERNWSFKDKSGNTTNVKQNIIVKDTIAPVITFPPTNFIYVCNNQKRLETIDMWVSIHADAEAIDNCSEVKWTSDYDASAIVCNSATKVTFTATDECGNSVSAEAYYTIKDTIAPIITAQAQDIEIECSNDIANTPALISWLNNNGGATSDDICSDVSWFNNYKASSLKGPGIYPVFFTTMDACGNTSVSTANINIVDTTKPIAPTAPADIIVDCSKIPDMINLTATDNCEGSITVTGIDSIEKDTNSSNIIIKRTWTFIDASYNSTTTTQIITVEDNTPPTLPTIPADITVKCSDGLPAMVNLIATDNCSADIIASPVDYIDDKNQCEIKVTRTWTFKDDYGNISSGSQIITVKDETVPIITTQAKDYVYECNSQEKFDAINDWLEKNGGAFAEDNCSNVTWSNNYDPTLQTCNQSIEVEFKATDDCGNSTITTAICTIKDTEAPVIVTEAQDIVIECSENNIANNFEIITWLNNNGNATAQEACSDITWTNNFMASILTSGTNTVKFTATDNCGNESIATTANIIINIVNRTPPDTPSAPDDITVECSEIPEMIYLTATDNNGGKITVLGVDSVNNTDPCNIIITRTWTFTDANGNSSSISQTIKTVDTTAPTLPTIPADITVECSDGLPKLIDLTATDNCSTDIIASPKQEIDYTNPCEIEVTRTWTFEDDCGNISIGSQIITIKDETAPVINNQAIDYVYECNGQARGFVAIDAWLDINGGATATDTCSNITWSNNYDPTLETCNQSIDVEFKATDECGNSTITTATYTIKDLEAPIINTEAQDITIECTDDVANNSQLITWLNNNNGNATAQDTCSDITWTNNFDANLLTRGINTITFIAIDNCGNESIPTTANIIIVDTTNPIAPTAPADITLECSDVPDMIDLTATDSCGGTITVTGVDSVNNADPCNVIITRTWTFTDASGNSSSISQTITTVDTTAPIAPTVPADVIVQCSDDIPAMIDLTATDNCNDPIVSTGVDTITIIDACSSITTRTWTFTDLCGNSTSVTQIITVEDTIAPTLVTDLDTEVEIYCSDIPVKPELKFTDNCSSTLDVDYKEVSTFTGDDNEKYIVIRDWKVTDDCGNSETFTQTTTVNVQQDVVYISDNKCTEGGKIDLDDYLTNTNGTWAVDSENTTISGSYYDPINSEVGKSYVFTFTEAGGCKNKTTVTININEDCVQLTCIPILPTTITPNGDQWNEYFTVEGIDKCGYIINIKIYNRWGTLIFKAKDYKNNWNGKSNKGTFGNANNLPTGTYYYIVTLKNSNLEPITGSIYLGTK